MARKDGRDRSMTKKRIEHLRIIQMDTCKALSVKYLKGQAEHGGSLWRKPVINFMGDELTDHICYFHVLKQQWNEMIEIADSALKIPANPEMESPRATGYRDSLTKIRNILTVGNKEGVREAGD